MPPVTGLQGSTEAPQQHKQTSRKGKKAWRKNIDVTDVQKRMEADVEEQILHGTRLADKKSEDLFFLDTAADTSLAKQFNIKSKPKRATADQIISQRSAVDPVSSKKRPAAEAAKGALPDKRRRKDWVSHKDVAALWKVADGNHEETFKVTDADHDPWAEATEAPAMPKSKDGQKLNFLPEARKVQAPDTMSRKPVSLAANGKPIPAVAKPSGGYSYNPMFDDYEKRLTEEGNRVVEAERQRLKGEEEANIKAADTAKSAAEAEAAEIRAEMSDWDDESAWEGFESEAEDVKTTVKRPERKTQAQRNKIKRRRQAEGLKKHEAKMKNRDAQAHHIRELAKQMDAKERQRQLALLEESEDSETEGNDTDLRRKGLGKFKLPEKDIELVLPDELQDSLRLLKPEGNLLTDRYRSVMARGKIEARTARPFKRQAQIKMTEKWAFKDFRLL